MGIKLKFCMFSFREDIILLAKTNSWNKKNAKLSNEIVHDLYTYAFLFVAVPLKSKSQINDFPHFNNVALACIVVYLFYL